LIDLNNESLRYTAERISRHCCR